MIAKALSLPFLTGRDQSSETRSRIDVLSKELASGQRADVGRAVASDFSSISRIVHDLKVNESRSLSLGRAASWLETTQTSLDLMEQRTNYILSQMPASLTPASPERLNTLSIKARAALEDMGTALAASQGGRSIFAPGGSGMEPPIKIDVVLAETAALAQGAVDLDGFLAAMDDYFAPPPGMGIEANAIPSYDPDAAAFPLGEGKSLSMPVTLADPGIRAAMKQAALIAALPDLGFPLNGSVGARLGVELPARNVQAASSLATTRGLVGSVEERVRDFSERLEADRTRLEGRRTDTLAADPFTTATNLQNEMTRLETIFAVTARRARLRLTDYLR